MLPSGQRIPWIDRGEPMNPAFEKVRDRCVAALREADPQRAVESILLESASDPAVAAAVAQCTRFGSLEDLAIHRSAELTLLAGALPPGFGASPHNHNLWSVVSVCGGQEDNQFFERSSNGLRQTGEASVIAPGVLANAADVIHAIRNPLDVPLLALHAYGGDLFATPRSTWDPDTQQETLFDWRRVLSKGK